MAEEEQLNILKQGVKAWNSWSKRHITTSIDLSGADLSEVNLSKVDLSEANLFGANLVGTNFCEADLSCTDLRWANLSEANLSNANLFEANLSGAGIINANLSKANLSYAYLNEAKLRKANLSEADLTQLTLLRTEIDGALFVNVDLSAVRDLQHCYHFGPSSIDHRTLSKSGQLPIEFLRGCGLSDWEIETTKIYNIAPTLEDSLDFQRRVFSSSTRPASQCYPLFISYSSGDEKVAKMVYRSLQASGVRCWFASYNSNIGCRFQQPVADMLQIHGRVILILSKNSIMSPWIRNEVEAGLAKERKEDREVLFPIKIDSAYKQDKLDWPWGYLHREIHVADFSEWRNQDAYNEAFKDILKALKG